MFRQMLVVMSLISLISSVNAQTPEVAPPSAAPAAAMRSEDGLQWQVLSPRTGNATPDDSDYVTLDYTGWNQGGEIFDSTARHPALRIFAVGKLFPGLRRSVAGMAVGEKRRVWIPATLAPKGSPIVMDVELRDITNPATAPADVAAPPASAQRSKSGLAWIVLKPSSAGSHPRRNGWVTVNYTGWTGDGKMFDTSYISGQSSSFNLEQVIPGWREGLQLMSPGEKRRFWIPEKAAYHGQPGMPAGMLVFDVELLKFR